MRCLFTSAFNYQIYPWCDLQKINVFSSCLSRPHTPPLQAKSHEEKSGQLSQRLQVIRRDVIPWILPPRPAGPDRHPAPASAGLAGPALAGEAGSATSPSIFCTFSSPTLSPLLHDATPDPINVSVSKIVEY